MSAPATYIVESVYANAADERNDERYECATAEEAGRRFDELSSDACDSAEVISAGLENGCKFFWTDPDTGRWVSAYSKEAEAAVR